MHLNYRMAIHVPWWYNREGMEMQLMSHCYLDYASIDAWIEKSVALNFSAKESQKVFKSRVAVTKLVFREILPYKHNFCHILFFWGNSLDTV